MKKYFSFLLPAVLALGSCKKELDVKNPNSPGPADAQTETGIISLSQGAVYQTGFNGITDSRYTGFLGDSYFSLVPSYHELLGDLVGATSANALINQVGVPDYVILDNGTKLTNGAPQKSVLRINNSRTKAGANPFFYEWTYMYFLNNACNQVLQLLPAVQFTGDQTSKMNAVKAWCYWWKGFAYSHIGSIYYAGLINSTAQSVNGNYVTHDAIIAEANTNFDKAIAALNAVTNVADYTSTIGAILPDFVQVGKGMVPTPAMWIDNINTMKARNLLVNKRLTVMTSADWTSVLNLTNAGVTASDYVFTGRAPSTNYFFSPAGGTLNSRAVSNNSTYFITERAVQDFDTARDLRFKNNFTRRSSVLLDQGGTLIYGTRWQLTNGGNGIAGTIVYADRTANNFELYIASTFAENALMKAEALIYTGQINQGLTWIDSVRRYQGAGLTALAGTTLTQAQAITILHKERRVALFLRALSFYDARRWGVIYDVSAGGGRSGAVVISSGGTVNTNATINYNFLDYWDVPDDESALNPPAAGSAAIKNPN